MFLLAYFLQAFYLYLLYYMDKRIKIAVGTVVIAIIAMLALQYVWINKYYRAEFSRVEHISTSLLVSCLEIELLLSDKEIQEYTLKKDLKYRVGSGADYETGIITVKIYYPEEKTIQRQCESDEELAKYSDIVHMRYHWSGINLLRLDSIYTVALAQAGILIPHQIEMIDCNTGKIIEATKIGKDNKKYLLTTKLTELGIDNNDALIARFDNSGFAIFKQMKNAVAISAVIMLLLATILLFLFRTIIYQKKLGAMREDYVNAMTHEIKNPIIYLKRVLGLIGSPEQDQRLRIANYKIEHLWLMLEKLLAVSSKVGLSITPENFDLYDLLKSIVSRYRLENPDLKITLGTGAGNMNIVADKLHISNAIINLIDNSVKYSNKSPVIKIKCYEIDRRLCVSVKDEGIGIPVEYHNQIFLKSFRVPEHKSLKRYGFGLGLNYVKMVTDAHHGSISLSSTPGKGSEFIIHLNIINISPG